MDWWDASQSITLENKYVVRDLGMPAEHFRNWINANHYSDVLPTDTFDYKGIFGFGANLRERYLSVRSRWIGIHFFPPWIPLLYRICSNFSPTRNIFF